MIQVLIDFAAYLVVRLLVAVIQAMPLDMGDSLCRGIATLSTKWLKIRRSATMENLSRVFPDATVEERRRVEWAMWHHLMLMVCEIAWAQRRLHLTNWTQYVRFRNNRQVLEHCLSNRAVVVVTGHFGNFEVGGYTTGLMGCESATIARRLDNPFLHRWVERFRSAKGQRMLDKDGCAMEVDEHLSGGGTLAILADQHAGPKGCWANFLGVPASCHKALALFSLSSDAPMLVGYTRRIDGKPMQFESGCFAVADPQTDAEGACESVTSLTRWYNRKLALCVDQSVEQYWWLHRRWREPPPKVARRLARAA
jgi:KDO2-lipid IV(A) lauroyltransferase